MTQEQIVGLILASVPCLIAGWFGIQLSKRADKRAESGEIFEGLKDLVDRQEREITRLQARLDKVQTELNGKNAPSLY